MKLGNSLLTKMIFMFITLLIIGCGSSKTLDKASTSTVNSIDGSSISYEVKGHGDLTIVFIHGWAGNREFWNNQVDFFSKKYKVVYLDLAGHGLSSSNRQVYTMSSFGEDVVSVINEIGVDNIILVGHSMGGPVAIEVAKVLTNKIIGIVGVDTFYTPFESVKTDLQIEEFMQPFKDNFQIASEQMVLDMFTVGANSDLIASITSQMSSINSEMGISSMYEIFRWNTQNIPVSLNKYSSIIDNINSAPMGDETILHESVVLIPEVGHFVAQVKPNEFNLVLDEIVSTYK